jgi:hypothetical protein
MSEPPRWEPPASTGPAPGPTWDPPAGWGSPPPGPGWAPPPGWSPSPPPAQPGVVPLRPLGVGEILDGAFRTVRRHPRATLGVAALAAAIQLATSLLVAAGSGRPLFSSVRIAGGLPARTGVSAASLLTVPLGAAVGAVVTAMIAVIASDAVLGRPTGVQVAWSRVRPLLWRLLVLGVVTTVGSTLGLVLLVVPGVFLWGVWALAVPAMALERTDVRGALRRSWRLAKPDWWRVWGTRALSVLLGALVSGLLSLPAAFYGAVSLFQSGESGDIGVGPAVVLTLTSAVASILVEPFLAAVLALLYIDRRMRAEGLDVTLAGSLKR